MYISNTKHSKKPNISNCHDNGKKPSLKFDEKNYIANLKLFRTYYQ